MSVTDKHLPASVLPMMLIAVLGLFWVYPNLESYQKEKIVGPSVKARRNPFLAAERFLIAHGFQAESVTGRILLNELPDLTDTLVVNNFFASLTKQKESALFNWIETGGHLILSPQKNWDDEAQSSGYSFFDELGVSRAEIEQPIETVSLQYDIEGPDIRVKFEPSVLHYYGDTKPVFVVPAGSLHSPGDNTESYHMVQLRYGAGLITITSDNNFLNNRQIGKNDHAFLLDQMVRRNSGKIWLLYDNQMPSLVMLLWEHGDKVLIPLCVSLILWLRKFARRGGPIREIEDFSQRNVLEQLDGKARFLWVNGGYEKLVYPNQQRLWKRWTAQNPLLSKLPEHQQIDWISQFSGLTDAEVNLALFEKIGRTEDLIKQTNAFIKLENVLKRGQLAENADNGK